MNAIEPRMTGASGWIASAGRAAGAGTGDGAPAGGASTAAGPAGTAAEGAAAGSPFDSSVRKEEIARAIRNLSTRVIFSLDSTSKQVVAQVVDAETNEVVRQIPPEELLAIRHRLDEYLGVLTDAAV